MLENNGELYEITCVQDSYGFGYTEAQQVAKRLAKITGGNILTRKYD